ncbi:MAG: sugar phosphate isomerase/epimerase [Kiritimatiellae bacterium]|nr:sugar phosphate isomerase/epimerase [Kiritimatiellia bacterium]
MKTPVRQSLLLAATLILAAHAQERSVGTGPSFKGPIGLQLYSLRDSFKQDVGATLDFVRELGFKYVELAGTYGLSAEAFRQMLDTRGLVAVAAHYPMERFLKDPDSIAREAKALGLTYVGVAWYPHKAPLDEAQARKMAADFNAAGRAMAERGLRFFYHNHGYEFHPWGNRTLMDLVIEETDPKLVTFEMDVLWTIFPGQDPAAWLRRYPGRWELMHLKDLKKGVQGDLSGKTDVRNDVALGTGQVDFPALLKAAAETGVKWYFIEDESPTVREQLPQSLRFLENVKW